jgi:hypothetical protein
MGPNFFFSLNFLRNEPTKNLKNLDKIFPPLAREKGGGTPMRFKTHSTLESALVGGLALLLAMAVSPLTRVP